MADDAGLAGRLTRLRGFSEHVAARISAISMPKNFSEAAAGARAITISDRLLLTMHKTASVLGVLPPDGEDDIDSARALLRDHADKLMAATEKLIAPASYREAERAARYALTCERMLRQLYAVPKKPVRPLPLPAPSEEPQPAPMPAPGAAPVPVTRGVIALPGEESVSRMTIAANTQIEMARATQAKSQGVWPDGTPYDPADPWYSCPRQQLWADTHPASG